MNTSAHLPAIENSIQLLQRHISVLSTLPETESPVISSYFDLRSPMENLRAAFETWSSAARNALPKPMRNGFDQAKAEIRATLKQLLMPMPFQASLDTHFDVSPRPAIFPLIQLKDRFHRFVLVICTEESGRILELTLGAVTQEILTTRPEHAGRLGRQLSREHFHHLFLVHG